MMLITAPFSVPKPVVTVIAFGSTLSTLPPSLPAIQVIMPGYRLSQPGMNRPCLEKVSLASSTRIFDFGLCAFRYQAIMLTRSYGPGGQRNGLAGGATITVPPSAIASSCLRSRAVCGPAFQACGITVLAACSLQPGTPA
jgi:hypothetical protein